MKEFFEKNKDLTFKPFYSALMKAYYGIRPCSFKGGDVRKYVIAEWAKVRAVKYPIYRAAYLAAREARYATIFLKKAADYEKLTTDRKYSTGKSMKSESNIWG